MNARTSQCRLRGDALRRLAWVVALTGVGLCAPSANALVTVHSRSGQFVIQSPVPTTPSMAQTVATTNRIAISLQAEPLAVSAERVKQRLLEKLKLPDRWRGKIHVSIHPRAGQEVQPLLVAARFTEGWQYSLDVPGRLEPVVLVRALVQALLTEMANRVPGDHSAEVPVWLVEGLTAELLVTPGPDLVLENNALVGVRAANEVELASTTRDQPIWARRRALQGYLRTHPPLAFNDLALPTAEVLADDRRLVYTASAHLFTSELLALPGGVAGLQSMIGNLSRTLNWQTAFLAAFQPFFLSLADAEKWWAVTSARFIGRDGTALWSRDETLDRLDEVLTVAVETQRAPGTPPQRESASLQVVINQVSLEAQWGVLRERISQLQRLQALAATECLPLVDSYLECLQGYLEQRARVGFSAPDRGHVGVNPRVLARTTMARLDALDLQRARTRGDFSAAGEARDKQSPASPLPAPIAATNATPANSP